MSCETLQNTTDTHVVTKISSGWQTFISLEDSNEDDTPLYINSLRLSDEVQKTVKILSNDTQPGIDMKSDFSYKIVEDNGNQLIETIDELSCRLKYSRTNRQTKPIEFTLIPIVGLREQFTNEYRFQGDQHTETPFDVGLKPLLAVDKIQAQSCDGASACYQNLSRMKVIQQHDSIKQPRADDNAENAPALPEKQRQTHPPPPIIPRRKVTPALDQNLHYLPTEIYRNTQRPPLPCHISFYETNITYY